MTIKLDPKYNSGVIQRLSSDTLLSACESNKKSGFTIETFTSFSGVKANLLIGTANVDFDVLKQTLKYFDQIHAYFTVFITFKPKLKFETFKKKSWTQVVDLKLNMTFLGYKEQEYLFSLFEPKDGLLLDSKALKASVMIQSLRLQTKIDISNEVSIALKHCKFIRTLEINSMDKCNGSDSLRELFLQHPKMNISVISNRNRQGNYFGAKYIYQSVYT